MGDRLRTRMLGTILAMAGCGSQSTPQPSSEAETAPPATASPWRYADALRRAEPKDAFEIVLELSRGERGQAWVVAGILRTGAARPGLEIWTFEQQPEDVALAQAGQPLCRPERGTDSPPAHDALRRNLAAPGAVVRRPLGLAAEDPAALLRTLAAHAKIVDDATAEANARTRALATLVQGTDDALVFEHDRLAEVLALMSDPTLEIGATESLSSRRARVQLTTAKGTQLVEVWAKGTGRVLVSIERAAPAPASGDGSTG